MVFELSLSELLLGAFFCSCTTVLFILFVKKFTRKIQKPEPRNPAVTGEPRDVLVGTLRNRLQLEMCIEHKFYHIPASRLSQNDFPIRYVAIYRSNHKFGDDSGISVYGKISRCSLVPRYKITEIPRDSYEMYYRFDIEEWKTLPSPIAAGEHDIINIMTTLYLLENSSGVSELMLSSREEHTLYRKILSCVSGECNSYELSYGTADILFDGGKISVTHMGKELLACTYADFSNQPAAFFKLMTSLLEQGGK